MMRGRLEDELQCCNIGRVDAGAGRGLCEFLAPFGRNSLVLDDAKRSLTLRPDLLTVRAIYWKRRRP